MNTFPNLGFGLSVRAISTYLPAGVGGDVIVASLLGPAAAATGGARTADVS